MLSNGEEINMIKSSLRTDKKVVAQKILAEISKLMKEDPIVHPQMRGLLELGNVENNLLHMCNM